MVAVTLEAGEFAAAASIVDYVQYVAGETFTLSMNYEFCGTLIDDNNVVIVWEAVSQSAANNIDHEREYYTSLLTPSQVTGVHVFAENNTSLTLSMKQLTPNTRLLWTIRSQLGSTRHT